RLASQAQRPFGDDQCGWGLAVYPNVVYHILESTRRTTSSGPNEPLSLSSRLHRHDSNLPLLMAVVRKVRAQNCQALLAGFNGLVRQVTNSSDERSPPGFIDEHPSNAIFRD